MLLKMLTRVREFCRLLQRADGEIIRCHGERCIYGTSIAIRHLAQHVPVSLAFISHINYNSSFVLVNGAFCEICEKGITDIHL